MLLITCLSLLLLVIAFEPVATTKTQDLVNYNGEPDRDTKPDDAKHIFSCEDVSDGCKFGNCSSSYVINPILCNLTSNSVINLRMM